MYTKSIKFSASLLLAAAFFMLAGCITQKKKGDVGKVGKAYQDMTARYNGYYNATNLLLESQWELEGQHVDNYNKILPIYKYSAADNPKAVAESLDEAIKKMTVVVNLREATHWADDCYVLAGKAQFMKQDYEAAEETFEYVIGEFSPQKMQENESLSKARKKRKKAVKKGKAPIRDENGEKVQLSKKQRQKLAKKKKKEREKERKRKNREAKKRRKGKGKKKSSSKKTTPQKDDKKVDESKPVEEKVTVVDTLPLGPNGYPLPGSVRLGNMDTKIEDGEPEKFSIKHRPAYQEAVLWLARTYIERENYTNAERLLMQLDRNAGTYQDVRREMAVAKAHYFMKQERYDLAIEPLETALTMLKDNKMKARLHYILGQLHKEAGNGPAAYAAFEDVLKSQPNFEMEFSARLNLALAGVNSQEESVKQLERMLKEEKNRDFNDRIYFALAEIDLQRGDKKAAIKHLELSLNSSIRDMAQKAESYLLLADLYYEAENFVDAKLYYDSTLLVLNVQDERYGRVNLLANNLEGIAENLQIISLQDSLLAISRMTEEEKREVAFLIKKRQDEERREAARRAAAGPAAGGRAPIKGGGAQAPRGGSGGIGSQSDFWAYDDKKVKDGLRKFQREWGNRDLIDNWRLSNQQSYEEGEEAAVIESAEYLTQEQIDEILKDVPSTPEEVAAAERQIEAAMFKLGTLYRDRIQNYEKAVAIHQELLNRYPQTQYQLDALYYLYLAYKDMGDNVNAQIYYDKIVNGYPQTNYARMLKDPNFFQSIAAKENDLTVYYNETFAAFENRQFNLVKDRISKVGEKFGATNKLQPRFALLNAMSVGNLEGKEKYIEALKDVIARYGDQPEAKTAREMLRNLGVRAGGPGQQRNLPGEEGQVGNFKLNDSQLHYVIVVFHNEVSLNDAKVGVSEYNSKYHSLQKLRMNNIYLGSGKDKYPIVAVRRFKDRADAMDYYDGVKKNAKDFLDKEKFDYELFPIAQDNYRELLKTKNLDDYRDFFELNYFD